MEKNVPVRTPQADSFLQGRQKQKPSQSVSPGTSVYGINCGVSARALNGRDSGRVSSKRNTEGDVPRAEFSKPGAEIGCNNSQERHIASRKMKTAKSLETREDLEVVLEGQLRIYNRQELGYWSQSGPTRFWKMGRKFVLKIFPPSTFPPHH